MAESVSKGPNNLKHEEAVFRSPLVSGVKYQADFTLTKGSESYHTHYRLSFHYHSSGHSGKGQNDELFLDFVGTTIIALSINGESKNQANCWRNNRIFIGSHLKEGQNDIEILYENKYDHTGAGFHQFIDPEDKAEYLYTNFEPFECHRWIPCFDQPDIKGELQLSVEAPTEWKVIANSVINSSVEKGDKTLHQFKCTPKISTYLFALVAGPYDKISDVYDERIPLGIYLRKSLRKYIDSDVIFTQTKQGLGFYEEFFDMKYPFEKYDQLFVPEFNLGAMENVGCVTFTERYVFKNPPTRSQIAGRSDTILHEMAHMWFGNLVSPVWWDGLWLNESFATYMASLCNFTATEFKGLSWQNFNSGPKQWAYREDQLATTHPIQGLVPDTEATQLIFDGITYGKGASVLKQLVHMVGHENFKAGMRYYFKKYAWGNTTISQFLEALAHANTKLDPVSWSREWLETAGLNTCELHYEESPDGHITSATINQTAPDTHPTLRNHSIEIVLLDFEGGELKLRESFNFTVHATAHTKVDHLIGKKVPSFIYLNYNDHGFAKFPLDKKSLSFILDKMEIIRDPLLRQLLWTSFYDLTRDAKMKSTDYINLVSSKISIEHDPKLLQTILNRTLGALIHFVPKSLVPTYSDQLFHSIYTELNKTSDKEFKISYARLVVEFARTEASLKILEEQLRNNNPLFSQDLRWSIIIKLVAWGFPEAQNYLQQEQQKDSSDTGARAVLRANISVPDIHQKRAAWERFVNPETKLSTHQSAAEMSGFQWAHQESILLEFTEKFFQVIANIFKTREKEYASAFFSFLYPSDPENPKILELSQHLLATLSPIDDKHLSKALKETIDDTHREIKCRNLILHS